MYQILSPWWYPKLTLPRSPEEEKKNGYGVNPCGRGSEGVSPQVRGSSGQCCGDTLWAAWGGLADKQTQRLCAPHFKDPARGCGLGKMVGVPSQALF